MFQVLSHLEHYRRSCRHGTGTGLYVHDTMQRALQTAYTHSTESTKVNIWNSLFFKVMSIDLLSAYKFPETI